MKKIAFGKTKLRVSRLCLGTMTFGWTADEEESFRIMDAAHEAGIDFFDTADIYTSWSSNSWPGRSEEIIGKWLKSRPGKKVVLASKVRGKMSDAPEDEGLSWKHVQKSIDGSLKRLGVDCLDLYQAHWPDEKVPIGETFLAFQDLIKQGKIRHVGLSNFDPAGVGAALNLANGGLPRVESLQPWYNLADRSEVEPEFRDLARKERIAIIPYSPLARGFLTGKYMGKPIPENKKKSFDGFDNPKTAAMMERLKAMAAEKNCTMGQLALAWILTVPEITAPIIGASTEAQLKESLGALEVAVSPEEAALLAPPL